MCSLMCCTCPRARATNRHSRAAKVTPQDKGEESHHTMAAGISRMTHIPVQGNRIYICDSDPRFQVVCHGIPDQRPLQDGDIVNVDVTAYYKGFHGDLNETFTVGTVDDDSKRLIRTTLEVSLNSAVLMEVHGIAISTYVFRPAYMRTPA